MTIQAKAQELINHFMYLLPDHLGALEINLARQCATKVVEEIIKSNPVTLPSETMGSTSEIHYWVDVLKILKNNT